MVDESVLCLPKRTCVMPSEKNLMPSSACVRQLGYRDKAWSVNRLGAVARRHGYGEACTRIINSLYGFNAMEVQEAFVKIREQVRDANHCQSLVSFFLLCSVHLYLGYLLRLPIHWNGGIAQLACLAASNGTWSALQAPANLCCQSSRLTTLTCCHSERMGLGQAEDQPLCLCVCS